MSDLQTFFIVILVIWLGIGGYVLYMHLKLGKLEKEIQLFKENFKNVK